MNIPGFRSGHLWKKVIAVIYYLVMGVVYLSGIITYISEKPMNAWLNAAVFWTAIGWGIFWAMGELSYQTRNNKL